MGAKLKAELEESNIAHEGTLAALRQKHNNNMAEMGEQIDSLNKMKAKADKDKAGMERDLQEARAALDEAMRDRANHERNGKLTGALIVESNVKLDEMARALNEADSSRKKLQVENQDLTRQIEEVENAIAALGKSKISLTTQLEDTKRLSLLSTPCMLRLMICLLKPRAPRKSPREPWLMLPVLLMNSGLSKIIPMIKIRPSVLLNPRSMN